MPIWSADICVLFLFFFISCSVQENACEIVQRSLVASVIFFIISFLFHSFVVNLLGYENHKIKQKNIIITSDVIGMTIKICVVHVANERAKKQHIRKNNLFSLWSDAHPPHSLFWKANSQRDHSPLVIILFAHIRIFESRKKITLPNGFNEHLRRHTYRQQHITLYTYYSR